MSFYSLTTQTGGGSGTVTDVTWTGGIVSIATSTTTPAFTITGTSGGIPYFSGTNTWASSGALTNNALIKGGGAGGAPSSVTTGTGVLTALGVNTGSAGAFVVNGGDLGTPSGGVVTNLSGTASININGTVGATTANTGTFSSTVHKGSTSGTVTIAAPATAGTQSYTLPSALPAANGYLLSCTTGGVMSWVAATASAPTSVEYLVVAGGGGGGGELGGGGGAGGYRTATGLSVSTGSAITVTVGAGGTSALTNAQGTNGNNSVFGSITSTGGGGGGGNDTAGITGGSGGGSGNGTGAAGTAGQGSAGGDANVSGCSGGGGGAGGVGGNATATNGGAGGIGLNTQSAWASATSTGDSGYYAGGGGGVTNSAVTPAAGGLGGGGSGGKLYTPGPYVAGTSGLANTGGGAGGTTYPSAGGTPAQTYGGSGIVIIRYADTYAAAASTTGSPTVVTSGGYRYYTWTGNGSITF